MKFQFKIEPFQAEAAEAVVKVFAGQVFKTYSPDTIRRVL